MVDLSFLMVTNREWDTFGKIVVDSLYNLSVPYSFEILVYSPTRIEYRDIKWHEDTTQSGCVAGYNLMVKHANGRYIKPAVDDIAYDEKVFKCISFLDSDIFKNRKYKICAVCTGGTQCIPSPSRPTEFGVVPYAIENNFRIVGFPVFSRETIELLGGKMFPSQFNHHYGDNWLPYFLGRLGEQVFECDGTPLVGLPNGTTRYEYDKHDFDVYCEMIKNFELNGNRDYCQN